MIATEQEPITTKGRISYFERLLGQLHATATPEDFRMVASGYLAEVERMQAELVDYSTRPLDAQKRSVAA